MHKATAPINRKDRSAPIGDQRAVVDVRLWVAGATSAEVYERITEFRRLADEFAPEGVSVRWTHVRGGHDANHEFAPTMGQRS